MNEKYMQFEKKNDSVTELYIYGDIRKPNVWDTLFGTDDPTRSDAFNFKDQLKAVDTPNLLVRINSYGGSVSEALAIYSQLQTFPGVVTTIVDGFACSAASVIFMAGKNRIVPESGLLMIHNAFSSAEGDYRDLKKASEDLEKIQQPSVDIYKNKTGLTEEEIRKFMDEETWINSKMAYELGFSTSLEDKNDAMQAVEAKFLTRLVNQLEELKKDNKDLMTELENFKNKEIKDENKLSESWDSYFRKGKVN